jgi:uncharacterized protein YjbI with pentapeptide repeats
MKKITNELRNQINDRIKKQIDISELIEGYDIRNEDLSRAVIKKFNRIGDNISNCKFTYAIIGEIGTTTDLTNTKMIGCNFKGTVFLGNTILRGVDARNCNFNGADLNHVDYRRADFRGGQFCRCILRIGTLDGEGAIFDKKILEDLASGWKLV